MEIRDAAHLDARVNLMFDKTVGVVEALSRFLGLSIPSNELTYTLQWDMSLERSTLMMVRIEETRGSLT